MTAFLMSLANTSDGVSRSGLMVSEYGDTRQTAKILNVSTSYLNKARLSGDGPPYAKFGKSVRYHLPTALSWAREQMRQSTSERRL